MKRWRVIKNHHSCTLFFRIEKSEISWWLRSSCVSKTHTEIDFKRNLSSISIMIARDLMWLLYSRRSQESASSTFLTSFMTAGTFLFVVEHEVTLHFWESNHLNWLLEWAEQISGRERKTLFMWVSLSRGTCRVYMYQSWECSRDREWLLPFLGIVVPTVCEKELLDTSDEKGMKGEGSSKKDVEQENSRMKVCNLLLILRHFFPISRWEDPSPFPSIVVRMWFVFPLLLCPLLYSICLWWCTSLRSLFSGRSMMTHRERKSVFYHCCSKGTQSSAKLNNRYRRLQQRCLLWERL